MCSFGSPFRRWLRADPVSDLAGREFFENGLPREESIAGADKGPSQVGYLLLGDTVQVIDDTFRTCGFRVLEFPDERITDGQRCAPVALPVAVRYWHVGHHSDQTC